MKTDRTVLYQESIGLLTKLPVGLSKKIRLIPGTLGNETSAPVHQVTQAQKDERERIARELHDETLQALFIFAREQEEMAN